jgi:hypothetical protein
MAKEKERKAEKGMTKRKDNLPSICGLGYGNWWLSENPHLRIEIWGTPFSCMIPP